MCVCERERERKRERESGVRAFVLPLSAPAERALMLSAARLGCELWSCDGLASPSAAQPDGY